MNDNAKFDKGAGGGGKGERKRRGGGRRRGKSPEVYVLRGEEDKMCPSATMMIPGASADHILDQGQKINRNQFKCLIHIGHYHTKGANIQERISLRDQLPPSVCNLQVRHRYWGGCVSSSDSTS